VYKATWKRETNKLRNYLARVSDSRIIPTKCLILLNVLTLLMRYVNPSLSFSSEGESWQSFGRFLCRPNRG